MPVCYPHLAGEPYRPSNGTEGELFHEQFCYRCRYDQDEDEPCEINGRALCYRTDEVGFPTEWVYDQNGRPRCTAFHDVLSTEPETPSRCPQTMDLFAK